MEALYLTPAGSDVAYRVWPSPEPVPEGAVQEARDHVLELREAADADKAELAVEGVTLQALRTRSPDTGRWVWSPGFNAGVAEAELRIRGRTVSLELVTDPAVGKATREAFDVMVGEILSDTLALLSAGGHRTGLSKGVGGRPPPLARLEYLRSRADRIAAAVRSIDASPRRTLVAETEALPYWRAKAATGMEIARSVAISRLIPDMNDPSVLPAALRGHLPAKIRKTVRRSSLDIPEHRAIKACLRHWGQWLCDAGDLLAAAPPESRKGGAAARMRAAGRTLTSLLALPLFDGVGEAPPRPEATPLFRHEPRYREFMRLHEEMVLGVTPVFGDFLDLPLARTHELYELWAYLRLVRASADMEGGAVDLSRLFKVSSGGVEIAREQVEAKAGRITVAFQRAYGECWRDPTGVGSSSRTMVPDIVVAVEGRPVAVALDAKYRIDGGVSDAMTSAHTYRDAIIEYRGGTTRPLLVGSFLLSPQRIEPAGDWMAAGNPARFFHAGYRAEFGIGAFSLPADAAPDVPRRILAEAVALVGGL
ncbi:MAG: DUF2357 domain-containing protein [Alphaproteobacteria bacterium]|nr:DUF2357 domain-containing protein [Alphaproteobacteria bacterium]